MVIKITLITLALLGVATALPQNRDADARTITSELDNGEELQFGRFRYGYQTSNGIGQQATGHIKNPEAAPEDQILSITGSYNYIDANGQSVRVDYIADENGFRPTEYFGGQSSPVPVQVAPVPVPAPAPVQVRVPVSQVVARPVVFGSKIRQQPIVVQSAPHHGFVHGASPVQYVPHQFNDGRNYVVVNPNYHHLQHVPQQSLVLSHPQFV